MPKRRHKEGNGFVSSSGEEAEAWPPLQESSRPPSTSQTASNVEKDCLQTERNPLNLEAPTMTSEIIQSETISSTNRNYSFYWKNQFEIPNFEGFNESLHISSEKDNPITPGQRPREVNTNNSTSMQPTVVLVPPVDDPTNKSFLSNEIKLAKALAASTFGNWGIGKITKNLVLQVLHSAGLLLAVLYAVAPTPAMSETKLLDEIAATVLETIRLIMEDAQKLNKQKKWKKQAKYKSYLTEMQ
ncbi:hypothetical protein FHG87_008191 [Trinorchestia longiramus]|nr:hypothetical protein FHG87_008191 [Trinorchestia longiramus]